MARSSASSLVRWATMIERRVVDDERTDEERDQGERQQEGVEDRDELLEGRLALLGELVAGDGFGVGRQYLGDAFGELVLGDAVVAGHGDPVQLPGLLEQFLEGGGVEQRRLGVAQGLEVAEHGDPHEQDDRFLLVGDVDPIADPGDHPWPTWRRARSGRVRPGVHPRPSTR